MSASDAILVLLLGAAGYALYLASQPAAAAAATPAAVPVPDWMQGMPPQPTPADPAPVETPDFSTLGQDVYSTGMIGAGLGTDFLSALNSTSGATMGSKISIGDVFSLMQKITSTYGFAVSPEVATAIAVVESGSVSNPALGCDPNAKRYEPGLGDSSAGLMQTLSRTANWLYSLGYNQYGIGNLQSLFDPETSAYFGCAYLDYLAKYKNQQHTRDFIVQSYNAGPGNASPAYLAKFNQAYAWVTNVEG